MAKKITYVEPASYFNADMKKAAREWDKAHKAETQKTAQTPKKGKK